MAHSFKINSGKNTFGVFKESQDAGDYIKNKIANTVFCKPNLCYPTKPVNTQGNYLLLTKSKQLNYISPLDNFNHANLNINLITKLDLKNVPVIQENLIGPPITINSPTTISPTVVPYLNYTIDPSGNLFGNTTCGINNYENYLVYNVPYHI